MKKLFTKQKIKKVVRKTEKEKKRLVLLQKKNTRKVPKKKKTFQNIVKNRLVRIIPPIQKKS